MSRYSLRATPRKKELFEGMVETPSRRRRKSQFPTEPDNTADESSAGSTPEPTSHASSTAAATTDTMATKANGEARRRAGDSSTRADAPALGSSSAASVAAKSPQGALVPPPRPDTTTRLMAVDGYVPGQDPRMDYSGEYEFGGPWGTGAMMIGFPLLMWYMWIGATYYDGLPPLPAQGQSWPEFAGHMAHLVCEGAFPSLRAFAIYWGFFLFEAVCYCTLPGVWAYGKPLLHENGRQLRYYCNGYVSLYVTAVVVGVLHYTGIFKMYELIDEFGPVLTVSIISGFAVSAICFVSAHLRGATHRMTGNLVYDFFMGAELNPRIGIFDLKMFLEVRFDWYVLFMLSCGAAARQYETHGYVSGEVAFLVLAYYLYANACSKGEELIVTTWDMYHEKGGFMYIFWTMSGVPFSYCHAIVYLANHHPSAYRWNPIALGALYVVYLFWYWVWDTCNSQKNRFRAAEKGKLVLRNTFPQLPWQTVHNPRTLTTPDGYTILVDGWYGLARKIHYAAETMFAISWGLVCGFKSPFPWFYPLFFVCMITHRALRDLRKCRIKYGETWTEYQRLVPYLFIPYVI